MSALDGGTRIAPPEFPLSFTPLSAATLGALHIPTTPTPPAIFGLSFTGNIAANNSTVSGGGAFHYSANVVGNYEIVVSRDGVDFDPGNPSNKVLLGVGAAGHQPRDVGRAGQLRGAVPRRFQLPVHPWRPCG